MKERSLIIISALLAEITMAFYLVLIFLFSGKASIESALIGTFLMFIIPNVGVFYFYRSIELSKVKTHDRYKFYVTVIICYFLTFFVSNSISISKIALSYFLIFMILFAINFKWRISLHAAGIGAASMALFLNFGLISLPFFVLTPFVYWLKMRLKSHNIYQLLAGTIVSFIISYMIFTFT